MTMSAYIDDAYAGDVATNNAWREFGFWADTLDPAKYREIVHLWENGWEQEIDSLVTQLRTALKDNAPADDDARDTARVMLRLLGKNQGAEYIVITDGVGHDSPDSEVDETEFQGPSASDDNE